MIPPYIIQNNKLTPAQQLALQGVKLCIGTPAYGGECGMRYTLALASLYTFAKEIGLHVETQSILNESLVQRARNSIAHLFMLSSCTHLISIDADINFLPTAPIELLLASIMKNEPLLGATYSKKEIRWDITEKHIKNGVRTDMLAHCSGAHVIQPLNSEKVEIKAYDLFPVKYLGTGFMIANKELFKTIEPQCKKYKNNHLPSRPIGEDMVAYFDCDVIGESYLSEDYLFCYRAMQAGVIPKLCPWITLAHYGSYAYEGCFLCSNGGYVHDVLDPKKRKN